VSTGEVQVTLLVMSTPGSFQPLPASAEKHPWTRFQGGSAGSNPVGDASRTTFQPGLMFGDVGARPRSAGIVSSGAHRAAGAGDLLTLMSARGGPKPGR